MNNYLENRLKTLSLRERASLLSQLVRQPGWELLRYLFPPEIRTRISDTDAKEAFIYESVRAQVIQEIFSAPYVVIKQAEREWRRFPQDNDNGLSLNPQANGQLSADDLAEDNPQQ